MSEAERPREKLGISMKMANGKVKIYKASRIPSIPASAVKGCLGGTTQKENNMGLPVCPERKENVFSFGKAVL